jgi:hypothetical protein
MNDAFDSVKIPIIPEQHEWFMYVIKGFELEVIISKGFYVVSYEDPLELYNFGVRIGEQRHGDFLSSNMGLPVKR